MSSSESFAHPDQFKSRHIGPNDHEQAKMLATLGLKSLDELVARTIPGSIRVKTGLKLGAGLTEDAALAKIRGLAEQNQIFRSYIGMGYVGTITPKVILRNILENPGWYTQYTPYQAEISQGRLEALLNFQTMIIDLTGLEIANASLLDEATAAAEAMAMAFAVQGKDASKKFFVAEDCHPQTIEVIRTRAKYAGITLVIASPEKYRWDEPLCGALFQYPNTYGKVCDISTLIARAKGQGALAVVACDPMSLLVLKSPGELGADMAVGNTQVFGVPMGFGGPHAAFLATRDAYKRQMPGRIVGLSKDSQGNPAIRLALQTREQHIRRDKATSNICTAQVLLAIMASMYAVYHGPKGLVAIAERIHRVATALAQGLRDLGFEVASDFYNTLYVDLKTIEADPLHAAAGRKGINFRPIDAKHVGITIDETVSEADLRDILGVFAELAKKEVPATLRPSEGIPAPLRRKSKFLTHPVFNSYHSETEMLRYITRLQSKDLSLAQSMIPLGSCTMKLNATTEMIPVSWPEFAQLHPFVPESQSRGYLRMLGELEAQLSEITGFPGISLQPNAGSQGEYAGLLAIRRYQEDRNEGHRDICLIPSSAHGTNPASAAMAGLKVVVVACDSQGNVDVEDLKKRAAEHAKNLSAFMITYPSTHGVFEERIQEICEIVHGNGGLVYMDGANMNAQVGLTKPGEFGPDVCHLNLHKTFCIPHGGGGPGMGPIGVKAHLKAYLPSNPVVKVGGEKSFGAISAAPYGSPSILPIPYLYILMMGAPGLQEATQVAILNANYVAKKLAPHYPVLYSGKNGFVAHECIVDLRQLKDKTGVEVEDVAKRLMDYGFHAPTISFPVPGTMMIEPTESESLPELDRFIQAMVQIREEIREIETGKAERKSNLLKNAPHTAGMLAGENWPYPYSRERACFPAPWVKEWKFWPAVSRIDNVYGERNLVCACPPVEAYAESGA